MTGEEQFDLHLTPHYALKGIFGPFKVYFILFFLKFRVKVRALCSRKHSLYLNTYSLCSVIELLTRENT